MKHRFALMILLAAPLAAQMETKDFGFQVAVSGGGVVGMSMSATAQPVQGAPYSATVVNESAQTLADGNRIVQSSTGTTARDSMGRTRNDAALPKIGNMSAAAAPHLVFIMDPVAQVSYTLNLDDKTAHAMPGKVMTALAHGSGLRIPAAGAGPQLETHIVTGAPLPPPPAAGAVFATSMNLKADLAKERTESKTEDLGTQVIEGVNAQG